MIRPSPAVLDHAPSLPGWDALLLAGLVCAVLMINGFAEATLPTLLQDELRHPLLGKLIPAAGAAAMGSPSPRPGDPLGLVLNALTLGLLLGYFVVDLALSGPGRQRGKWLLLGGILLTALFLPTGKLILLRQGSGPASYTHDGGVIQTEATIAFLLQGKNPYRENYDQTPMAEWGFSKFRTALYHYPYLPWTFLFSAPFYVLGQSWGFYDQRLIYLGLLVCALVLAPRLVRGERQQLALVAGLGLNPIMTLDLLFGQNDAFVLCWLIFSLVSWRQGEEQRQKTGKVGAAYWLAPVLFGLACASKPTAWFFAPFWGLLVINSARADRPQTRPALAAFMGTWLRRLYPAAVTFALLVLPYVFWDPWAFYDDIWRWSNGRGETGYQIWGWGASNFVLAFGLVTDRFQQWPFWVLEVILATPLLLWFLRRQQRMNTLGNACWHYGVFLLAFFYGSRFLNENYLGYILAFLLLGVLSQIEKDGERSEGSYP